LCTTARCLVGAIQICTSRRYYCWLRSIVCVRCVGVVALLELLLLGSVDLSLWLLLLLWWGKILLLSCSLWWISRWLELFFFLLEILLLLLLGRWWRRGLLIELWLLCWLTQWRRWWFRDNSRGRGSCCSCYWLLCWARLSLYLLLLELLLLIPWSYRWLCSILLLLLLRWGCLRFTNWIGRSSLQLLLLLIGISRLCCGTTLTIRLLRWLWLAYSSCIPTSSLRSYLLIRPCNVLLLLLQILLLPFPSLLFLLHGDLIIQCFTIFLNRELLIIIHWNRDDSITADFFFWTMEILHVWML